MSVLRRFLLRHKARLARLTAVAGLLGGAMLLMREVPRAVNVELVLGQKHSEVVEVRIDYLREGEEVHGVALSFPQGAPAHVRHSVSLPAGDFEVRTEARLKDGAELSHETTLHAPVEGTVRILVSPTGDE